MEGPALMALVLPVVNVHLITTGSSVKPVVYGIPATMEVNHPAGRAFASDWSTVDNVVHVLVIFGPNI